MVFFGEKAKVFTEFAKQYDYNKCVELREAGARINCKDKETGKIPLHFAAECKYADAAARIRLVRPKIVSQKLTQHPRLARSLFFRRQCQVCSILV